MMSYEHRNILVVSPAAFYVVWLAGCTTSPDPVGPEVEHWQSPVLVPDKMMRRVSGCPLCGTTDHCRVNPPHNSSGIYERDVPNDWSPPA